MMCCIHSISPCLSPNTIKSAHSYSRKALLIAEEHFLFNRLPKTIDNFLVAIFGAYLWALPMHMGFFEYFKNWGI